MVPLSSQINLGTFLPMTRAGGRSVQDHSKSKRISQDQLRHKVAVPMSYLFDRRAFV